MRVGAATRCPSCGHAWRISASHIRRVTRAMAEAAAAAEPTLDEDPPESDARAGSSVTGMSGLSDLMQAEPSPKSGDTAVGVPSPPIREAQFGSAAAAQKLAKSAAHLRQTQRPGTMSHQTRRMAILVIAALALGVALAGIGLVMLGGNDSRGGHSPTLPADADAGEADDAFTPAGPPSQPQADEPGASRPAADHILAAGSASGPNIPRHKPLSPPDGGAG